MKILISGGAGFVGSYLAQAFKNDSADNQVVVFDNLKRRGSELNLAKFKKLGIPFYHGDVRQSQDFHDLAAEAGNFDLFIEASAEPSVLAGLSGSSRYLFETNLVGTYNALEFAQKNCGAMVFLSTSRVYSLQALQAIELRVQGERFVPVHDGAGLGPQGIREDFSTRTARSLYGTTKLASEMLIQEFAFLHQYPALVNRCGVLAGPGQFGKVDQGVFTLWVANHYFNKPLAYQGYGGQGHQVRDLLHPEDLFALLKKQLPYLSDERGEIFNVSGGVDSSTSLRELTQRCEELTGHTIDIASRPETHAVDIPWLILDSTRAKERFLWSPKKGVKDITHDIYRWIQANEDSLKGIF